MTRKTSLGSAALAALALFVGGCPGHIADPGQFVGTLDSGATTCMLGVGNVESEILATRCAMSGCHDSTTHQQGLDLGSPNVSARLINAPSTICPGKTLVVMGSPATSYLIEKLGPSPTCGVTMPEGMAPLTADEMACVRAWIVSLTPPVADSGMPDVMPGMDVPQSMPDVQPDTGVDATAMDVPATPDVQTDVPVSVDMPTMPDTAVRDTAMPDTSTTPDAGLDSGG